VGIFILTSCPDRLWSYMCDGHGDRDGRRGNLISHMSSWWGVRHRTIKFPTLVPRSKNAWSYTSTP